VLADVNATLATLSDTDGTAGADTIAVNASDSFGHAAAEQSIAVTVAGGQTFTLTRGADTVAGGSGNDTIDAATNTLSAGDQIDGGGGTNTLNLEGAGLFNLGAPTTLTNVQVVDAQEGQAAYNTIAATNQSITLRSGLNVTVDVSAATINPSNPKPATITILGANDASVINLASGNDLVVVGGPSETVHGGSGNDQIEVTAATIGATIDGGTGQSTLDVLGGGAVTMGKTVTNISDVVLAQSTSAMSFIANATDGLAIDDSNRTADSVTAGGANQTLTGGTGNVTFVAFSGGDTTIKDTAAALNGDTIANFYVTGTEIDLTDVSFANLRTPSFAGGALTVSDGTHTATMNLTGSPPAGTFVTLQDSGTGTLVRYQVTGS
jgi:hypothetical protein